MSGPPRRRPKPAVRPPAFEDERPTPVATPTSTTLPGKGELPPEPPTVLAISITAPTFTGSGPSLAAKPTAPSLSVAKTLPSGVAPPSFAEAAATGPFAKTHVRDAEPSDRKITAPATPAITAPSFAEAAAAGPFAKTHVREGDTRTVSERVGAPPGQPRVPLLESKPTEVSDPWEYRGEGAQESASLSSGYEGAGVELDTAGRLVAPGLKPRGKKPVREDSGVSGAPADLLSVGLEMWPEDPPPQAAAPAPRIQPVPAEPPPEPSTDPRPPPPPDLTPPPRRSPKRSVIGNADTVLRAPRGAPAHTEEEMEPVEPSPEEQFYEEEEEPPPEEEYLDEPLETNIQDTLGDPTNVGERPRRSFAGTLFRLLLLGAAVAVAWAWYTGQLAPLLARLPWPR